MGSSETSTPCPNCKAPASGRFCASCGGALEGAACPSCSKPLASGARFCHHCGTAMSSTPSAGSYLTWIVPGIAVLAVVAFLIGQRYASNASNAGNAGNKAGAADTPAAPTSGMRAPDISTLSPEQRASMLFDRVMRYGEEGKIDSLKFFAPMAIQAYDMLGPATPHTRYDVGMIAIVSGDLQLARAEADTILAANKTHLLGLILATKAAGLRNDMKARAEFQKRFMAAEPAEIAKNLKEYSDHKADIDAALRPTDTPGAKKP